MRVGLPRALMYYEFYPLWRTFLERLDCEVVTSRRTNKALLEAGVQLAQDEACLPVKLALGHVRDLIGRCDTMFIPRLFTIEHNGYLCPKIVGFPDIVQALPLDCPPLLAPIVDVERKPDPVAPFLDAGRELGKTETEVRAAYDEAKEVHERFFASVRAGRPLRLAIEDFERGGILPPNEVRRLGSEGLAGGKRLKIALLGHPYNVHDPYLSMDIAEHLEALGCEVVPVEMVPEEACRRALESFDGHVYWVFAKRVLGPVLHFMEHGGVDGLVYVVSFGCGPDALLKALIDLWAKKRPDLPYVSLVLDEHAAEGGLLTRLEAFVDMTRRRLRIAGKSQGGLASEREDLFVRPEVGPRKGDYAVTFPHFGSLWIPVRAMMEALSLNTLVAPANTRRTLDIGSAHSPELACIPFKLMLGNYIEALEKGATHLLGLSSRFGATCRLYFFPCVHEAILRDLGYDFELVTLDSGQRDSGPRMAALTKRRIGKSIWTFARLFFSVFVRKLLACEKIEHLALATRPYEVNPGDTSRLARRALSMVDRAEPRNLRRLVRDIEEEFRSVEQDRERRPLRIALIGEQFVLIDPFSNLYIEEKLGNLGVLVERNFWLSKKILRSVWRRLDTGYTRAMDASTRYLGVDVGAECNVTVGDTVVCHREGFDGAVHLMPFTCMPEIVAESILPRAKADSGLPLITFALDEQTSEAGMMTRLEAFIDLLKLQRDHGDGRASGKRNTHSQKAQ